jgi:predicted Ser/Thr protein kinase
MRDELTALIEKHWAVYGLGGVCDRSALHLTKFCQRVVQPHTKVLFFVSYLGAPLCILKTVRGSAFNDNLLREARHQAAAPHTSVLSAPKVYWVDQVGDRAVYAEEYINALPVAISDYRALGPHITEFVKALTHHGSIRSDEFIAQITHFLPNDPIIQRHATILKDAHVDLALGLSHGDLGRQNILGSARRAWVVDWERAGDIPFSEFDIADYTVKVRGEVQPALASLRHLYTALYTRFPDAYRRVALYTRDMVGST